jgi:hypothetical protein
LAMLDRLCYLFVGVFDNQNMLLFVCRNSCERLESL